MRYTALVLVMLLAACAGYGSGERDCYLGMPGDAGDGPQGQASASCAAAAVAVPAISQ